MPDDTEAIYDALNSCFDTPTLERGETYFGQDRVQRFSETTEGFNLWVFEAIIQGSGGQRYECRVMLDPYYPENLRSLCSCPVQFFCKHAVAVLLEAEYRRDVGLPASTDSGDNASQVRAWLARVNQQQGRTARDNPTRLVYLLLPARRSIGLSVVVYKANQRRNGSFSNNLTHSSNWATVSLGDDRPAYIQDDDIEVLGWLRTLQAQSVLEIQPRGRPGYRFLQAALATGRVFWQTTHTPLASGDDAQASIEWQQHDDGTLTPQLNGLASDQYFIPTEPALYLDASNALIGALELPGEPKACASLLEAPAMTAEQVQQHLPDIEALLTRCQAPLPPSVTVPTVINEPPKPVLMLAEIPPEQTNQDDPIPVIRVNFRYGDFELPWHLGNNPARGEYDDTTPALIHRDWNSEYAWRQQLPAFSALRMQGAEGLFTLDNRRDWLDLLAWRVPRLHEAGWEIVMDEDLDIPVIEAQQWYGSADTEAEAGWFNLELGIVHDEQTINLVPLLLQGLDHLREDMTTTAEGDLALPEHLWLHDNQSLIRIPSERVRPMLEVALELYRERDPHAGQLRLSRVEAARVIGASEIEWRSEQRLQTLARELASFETLPQVPVPEYFHATLRDYQKQGLDWLQFLFRTGLGGILADDMGLGKTIQTLAHLQAVKEAGHLNEPALVVCPTSVLPNWRHEAQRFAPELQQITLHGPRRHQHLEALPGTDLVFTSYPLLSRDRQHLEAIHWSITIFDEAQKLKNPNAAVSKAARAIPAEQTIVLTGTPMENHLGELWSLFNLIAPGYLGDHQQFRNAFRNPIEKDSDADRYKALTRRIRPFLLRRTKDEVTPELPEKTEIVRGITLTGAQRDLYETVRASMDHKVRQLMQEKGVGRSQIEILEALLKLRQACCHPALVKSAEGKRLNSAKIDYLMEMLGELLEEGRRILIFSQFTSMLELIETELRARDWGYSLLTGDTRNRDIPISNFQAGEVPIFLISLRAGGVGLNLTAADCVIHYDPWWNPAVEDQATDRAWRIGQDKPVIVYRLICEGTVEERMESIKARKAELADAIYGEGGSFSSTLTAEDVQALLQPIGS